MICRELEVFGRGWGMEQPGREGGRIGAERSFPVNVLLGVKVYIKERLPRIYVLSDVSRRGLEINTPACSPGCPASALREHAGLIWITNSGMQINIRLVWTAGKLLHQGWSNRTNYLPIHRM